MSAPQESETAAPAARRRALVWIGAFVAASAVVLAVGGDFALVGVHALLLGVIVWSGTSDRPLGRFIGDVAPLVIAVALYSEIPRLIGAMGTSYHDATIQQLEQWLFGTQPARVFARALPWEWLSELLHAGYMLFYPLIFVPPLLLYVRGERRGFGQTIYALTVTWVVCWVCFVLWPVEGPRYEWGVAGAPDGPMRRLAVAILAAGSSRGAAFPSSHMAVSVVQSILALKWQRSVGVVCATVGALIGIGAVYGGFHYAVDMLAGAALGTIVAALSSRA